MKATDRLPESFNGLPMRLDTVDRFVFEGLQSRFLELFNSPSVWTTSSDKVRSLDKLFGNNGKTVVKYPYVYLSINSWELAEDRHNLRTGTLSGTQISLSSDRKSSVRVRYLPVNFSVETEFVTNSFTDQLDFARRWLFASKKGGFNFQVEYGQTRFDIKVLADLNLTFPKRDGNPESVQEYVATSNLIIQGFISEPEAVQQHSADTVEVTMAENPGGTLWKFRRDQNGFTES